MEPIPNSWQALPLDATYAAESGRSPTSTVARVGFVLPAAVRFAIPYLLGNQFSVNQLSRHNLLLLCEILHEIIQSI
jgi:hypothetical protein